MSKESGLSLLELALLEGEDSGTAEHNLASLLEKLEKEAEKGD